MINIKKLLKDKPKPDIYVLIRQGDYGLETFINDKMLLLKPGYRSQMIAFLEEILEVLKENGKGSKTDKRV